MKRMKLFSLAFLAILFCFSCTEDAPVRKQKVQFELSVVPLAENAAGRVQSPSEIPANAKLRLSLETSAGEEIFNMEDFDLLRVGDNVITPAIELSPGTYVITDFMIVNAADEVLFATPRSTSPLSRFVANPLDVVFTVEKDHSTKIAMEVVPVSESLPEDFGYATFGINVVRPFPIAVFEASEEGTVLTPAKLIIEKGDVTLQSETLEARVNTFAFRLDPNEIYTMRITKPGFLAYQAEFTYNDLKEQLREGPLNVALIPGMTIVTPFYGAGPNSPSLNFWIYGSGLHIDWGDGSVGYDISDGHKYEPGKRYVIHVSGALESINEVGGVYNSANFHDIDFTRLTNLRTLDFTIASTPKRVDLSTCTRLSRLNFFECRGTEELILPRSPELVHVIVSGSQLSTAAINAVIDRMHANAKEFEIYSGEFRFIRNTFGTDDMTILAGPPDEAALEKLRELRDVYHWTIEPEEF
jgi:hypothetical protein